MPSLPVPCTGCGRLRPRGGKSLTGVCLRCHRAKFNRASMEHAATQAKHHEKVMRVWIVPDDRPRCLGYPSGTITQWGSVQARGIRGGERYYDVIDPQGNRITMPAAQVEAGA
jgi:predicted  nucleic acid-binding Zn-ribbon protein